MSVTASDNGTYRAWKYYSARVLGDEEGTTSLRVTVKHMHAKREDGSEAAALEAEEYDRDGDAGCAMGVHGRGRKYETQPEVRREHVARLNRKEDHQKSGEEVVECVGERTRSILDTAGVFPNCEV